MAIALVEVLLFQKHAWGGIANSLFSHARVSGFLSAHQSEFFSSQSLGFLKKLAPLEIL